MTVISLAFGCSLGWCLYGIVDKKMQETVHALVQNRLEEMRLAYLEFEDVHKECHRLEEEKKHLEEEMHTQLQHKEALLGEYQKTTFEQRMIIEKKQLYISKLETQVKNLMSEIRNLLLPPKAKNEELSELDASGDTFTEPFSNASYTNYRPYDFSILLKKYIGKAESLTGADHLGYLGGKTPRFSDLSLECYALDRRRLCDSFKDETRGILFIFSPLQKKFLFINNSVKSFTGWGAEKFMKEFPRLVVKGYREWEEALLKFKKNDEIAVCLSILDKDGQPKSFDCYMGYISKGPFSNHVAGILALQ